jgi:acyl-coenzyme A thioesterase PaaI-like protein
VSDLRSEYARVIGVRLSADAAGRELLLLSFGPHLLGRPGFLHGGAIAGLLSLACEHAVGQETGASSATTPRCVTSTFQFLRGGREQDVYAAATVQRGRALATVIATAWQDSQNKPVAVVTRKYLIG